MIGLYLTISTPMAIRGPHQSIVQKRPTTPQGDLILKLLTGVVALYKVVQHSCRCKVRLYGSNRRFEPLVRCNI